MEIEVKLLLNPSSGLTSLSAIADLVSLDVIERKELGNRYFDTPDLALRRQDMGLRIRRSGAQREQTLKTQGQVTGGLHARPEYNAKASGEVPDLALFPDHLWSLSQRQGLQEGLRVQFETDFVRESACLDWDGARIELALDRGEVMAGEGREAIAELELELVTGEPTSLLSLAEVLMGRFSLRLGLDSKAARGYRLAGLSPMPTPLQDWPDSSAGRLQAWQRNEERVLAGEVAALAPLQRVLDEIAGLSPLPGDSTASVLTRQGLEAMMAQPRYGLGQLALLRQLLSES
ncbi:CYTH domain-containing protein [Ferrimonas gelatinilytica]|uniref:CYTH domain-containing protein n=1 Tax=Ferrimonas gelatinilytica TaxID=1255257 RepID=A0ABP9S732_9GAMM